MGLELTDSSLLQGNALINGEWLGADDGAPLAVTNPATGAVLAETAKCGGAETRRAHAAATPI